MSLPSKNGRAPPFLVHSYKGGSECEGTEVGHRVGNEHRIVPDAESSTRPSDRSEYRDIQDNGFISFDVNGSFAVNLKGLVHGGDVAVCLGYDKVPSAQVASNHRLRAYLTHVSFNAEGISSRWASIAANVYKTERRKVRDHIDGQCRGG